jgi:hypothetical protein
VIGRRLAAVAALLATLVPAFAQPALQCTGTQKPMAVAELMFGRNIGRRIGVSETQWRRFVDREITPRFPLGLTIVDARGQWRDAATKALVREPSKLVTIVLPGEAGDDARLNEIATVYKKRFRQDSVGIIVRPACVAF